VLVHPSTQPSVCKHWFRCFCMDNEFHFCTVNNQLKC